MTWRVASAFATALAAVSIATSPARLPAQNYSPDPQWVSQAVIYEVFVQDFAPDGTLRGVTNGLNRIHSAGADVIWLMPLQPIGVLNRKGTLGSPYSIRDYHSIDPSYGTADDLRALVRAAHSRDMKVILDWVPDHTSWDHAWITAHPDWYVHDSSGAISVPRDGQGKATDWTDVAQLDYRNADLRRAMTDEMRWWMTTYDLDGFRMDVAGFVPYDYWREALPALRAVTRRPIMLLAEWGDVELNRIGFDLTYGWDGYAKLKEVWRGAPASGFTQQVLGEIRAFSGFHGRLRFTTNHDETHWDNPPVVLFGGPAGARAAFVAMALLPGRPMLYNGQEVEDPHKPQLFEPDPRVAFDRPGGEQARGFYAKVLELATRSSVMGGAFRPLQTSAPDDVISYARGSTLVLVNTRDREVQCTVRDLAVSGRYDVLNGRVQGGETVILPAFGAKVLIPRQT